MASWLEWYQQKKEVVTNFIYDSANQLTTTAQTIWSYRSYVTYIFDPRQFWEGWTRFMQPNVPALFESPKTCGVIAKTLTANLLFYAGSAFVYEATLKPAFEETPLERTVKLLAAWYFWRLSWRMFASENPIYNASLSKAVAEENPNQELFPACACGENSLDVVKANLASGFYYFSHIKAAQFMGMLIPYSEPFFMAQAYGEALLEYNLGRMCTVHRYETIAKNNSYAFGFGLSMVVITKICSLLISMLLERIRHSIYTNPSEVDTTYIDEAVAALVFQYFIMVALMIDKPYPGKQLGKDIFFHARLVMESLLKQGGDTLIPILKKPKIEAILTTVNQAFAKWFAFEAKVKEFGAKVLSMFQRPEQDSIFTPLFNALAPAFNKVNNYLQTQSLKNVIVYPEYQSLDKYVKTPEVQLFLDLRGDDIQGVLDWFIKVRKQPNTKRLAFVMPYIPNFFLAKEMKAIIKFLVEKKLNGVLEGVNDFITTARLKIKLYDAKTLQEIAAGDREGLPAVSPPAQQLAIEAAQPVTSNVAEKINDLAIISKPLISQEIQNYEGQQKEAVAPPLTNTVIPPGLNTWVVIENYSPSLFQQIKQSKKHKNRVVQLEDDIDDNWEDLATKRIVPV